MTEPSSDVSATPAADSSPPTDEFTFACVGCGRKLKSTLSMVGRAVRCPECATQQTVVPPGSAAPQPPNPEGGPAAGMQASYVAPMPLAPSGSAPLVTHPSFTPPNASQPMRIEPAPAQPAAGQPAMGQPSGTQPVMTITADDHVVRWTRARAGAQKAETDLGPNPAFAADMRSRLDRLRFAEIQFNEVSNMTCSLDAGGHRVSWPWGDARAPSDVVAIHGLVLAAGGG